ncbi:tRNA-specific adenosine deaminase subunit tad3 [Myotisia sp. PD_48]|nr:tRNA-specific adenosine deaminase subunit tad3 [Myotisia sp. PD_48]
MAVNLIVYQKAASKLPLLVSLLLNPPILKKLYNHYPTFSTSTMGIPETLKTIKARTGLLVTLPSVQELQPVDSFEDAYVAEIDIKSSNKVLRLLDKHFQPSSRSGRSHLRRLVRPNDLPDPLRRELAEQPSATASRPEEEPKSSADAKQSDRPRTIHVLIPPPLLERSELEELLLPYAPSPETSSSENTTHSESAPTSPRPCIRIQTTRIPTQPPTSAVQANEWSRTLWSTQYNQAAHPARFAPPQVQLTQTKASVAPSAGYFLALAEIIGNEARDLGRGRPVGAVIVDPGLRESDPDNLLSSVVAVAGDARYHSASKSPQLDDSSESGPESHALMRIISMVSHKRLTNNNQGDPKSISKPSSAPSSNKPKETELGPKEQEQEQAQKQEQQTGLQALFDAGSTPPSIPSLSPLESHFFEIPNIDSTISGGYLCTDLDLYMTHEPCLCCSMGMLLSRFRSITVLHSGMRRNKVGNALDAVNGYGLHWREKLNWRAIGFEYIVTDKLGTGKRKFEDSEKFENESISEVEFNA